MDNFIYGIPTTTYFGKGQINILGETIRAYVGSKVLRAYGGESVRKTGICDAILKQFGKAGKSFLFRSVHHRKFLLKIPLIVSV